MKKILIPFLALLIAVISAMQLVKLNTSIEEEQQALNQLKPSEISMPLNENDSAKAECPAILNESLAALKEQNDDFVCWISIDGTKIDYPVMQGSPDSPDFYLHHDFNKEDSESGLPYLNFDCNLSSTAILVYGHNMKNGSMFAGLLKFADEKYCQEHNVIRLETPQDTREFRIVSAFYDRVYYQDEDVFKYYNYVGNLDETAYPDFVKNVKEKSLYDTGITPSFGDQLLILSTCAYHVSNGRFVVVAVR